MKSSIARVSVNGIEVGSLPADTYHALVKSVRRDRMLYLAWVAAAVKTVGRLLLRFYLGLPRVIGVLVLFIAAVSPETLTAMVVDFRAAEPQEITEALRKLIGWISFMFMLIAPLTALFAPHLARIESPFDMELSR